jgi:hypothetical protein
MFIDLKNAYDKVNHLKLFDKLRRSNVDEELISIVEKIYSFAAVRTDNMNEMINVNNGVLQGSLISPMLFNLYINDLVIELGSRCYETLAYADDLAVICKDNNELDISIKTIDKWSENNDILVNRKKSGIFIITKGFKDKDISGYPRVREYKYLGVLMDEKLNCLLHIRAVNKKLSEYLRKNFMLNKHYFSVKSIIAVFYYFHKSRLLYGMCNYVDLQTPMLKLESSFLTGLKNILGLPINTSNDRLKLAMGIPDLKLYLKLRVMKNLEKYDRIFGEKCTLYDKIATRYYIYWFE